jgi:uncharacterized protein (TIGR03086 family)
MDLPAVHASALEATRATVAGVRPDQWDAATPCEGWSTRELVNHVVAGNFWVAPLVEGKTIVEVGDQYDGDVLGDDPLAAYDESARAAADAFRSPGAMTRPVAVSYGPVPGEVYAGHRFTDVLVHGWDLAKATGQDTTLDADLVQACWDVISPQAQLLAGSGAFAQPIEVDEGADLQTRLLAILGRQP